MFDVNIYIKVLLSAKLAFKNMFDVKFAVKNTFDINVYIKVLLSAKLAVKKYVKRKVGRQKYV
jgi:hypothetical protein